MLNNNKIKIAMLDISPQNKGILEFYFDRAGKGLYNLVSEAEADALIIDYDQYGAKEHLTEILSERKLPILLISIREQSIDSTIWVAKPLSTDALNKAAESVREMMIQIEESTQAEVANEAETEKETFAEEEKLDVIEEEVAVEEEKTEVITDFHMEESESVLDESLDEIETFEEPVVEKSLEIDEMVLEEENVLDVAEENNKVDSGLAIAGVAASALATSSLIGDDADDTEDNILDFDDSLIEEDSVEKTTIEETTDEVNSDEDFVDLFEEVLNEDPVTEVEEGDDDDVDALLDSLLLEDNDEDDQSAADVVDSDDEDIFLDNLLTDDEINSSEDNQSEDTLVVEDSLTLEDSLSVEDSLSIEDSTEIKESLEIDVLKSVDSELEGNFDLQNSADVDSTKHIIEEEKTALLDENFTIHDDLDPSTEDVYADTLEVNYAELKTDDNDVAKEASDSLSEDSEELSLNLNDDTAKQDSNLQTGLDESLDSDFDFDFESLENTEAESEVANTKETNTELSDDFELTLLNETDSDEKAETNATEDGLDNDLDSLLQEVSENSDDEVIDVIDSLEKAEFDEISNDNVSDDILDEEISESDLQSLLNEVREEANAGASTDRINEQSKQQETAAEKRWMQLCGNETTIKNQKESSKITFKTDKFLLSVILEQIKSTKNNKEQLFRLKYQDLIIVIDHSQSKIYCNTPINSDEYSTFCYNEIETDKVKIHDLDYSEVKLYRNKIEKNPDRAHSFESFVWTTSLLTSRGRLPENTNVTKSVGLKTWPNLTRLELMPHAMNIAAVFAKNPGSLLEIPNWLNIQQRYVFAFYNAALSLEMIEFDAKKSKKSAFSFGKKDSKSNSEERGFFGRLLKRLKT